MGFNAKDLNQILVQQFFQDGEELVAQLEQGVAKFSTEPEEGLKACLRCAHNFKGAAQLSGFSDFSAKIHNLESVLEALRDCQLSADFHETCSVLLKRIATLTASFFNHLVHHEAIDSRDEENWKAAVEGLGHIAQLAPRRVQSSAQLASVPPSQEEAKDDDWGLSSVAVPASTPPTDVKPATYAAAAELIETPAKISDTIDFSQGWGIFEEVSIPSLPQSVTTVVAPSPTPKASAPETPTIKASPIAQINSTLTAKKPFDQPADIEDYLLCRNQGASFALPVKQVQEILPNRAEKRLPVSRKGISGVISFRGKVMAILSLFDKGEDQNLFSNTRCIVVCQIGTKQFGFRVDEVLSVISVKRSTLQAVPGIDNEVSIVQSLAQIDGRTVSFVEPGLVFSK